MRSYYSKTTFFLTLDSSFHKIWATFYWNHIRVDIMSFIPIPKCETCQRLEIKQLTAMRLLQPLPIPSCITTFQLTGYQIGKFSREVHSTDCVVNHLSKYCYFTPILHLYTAISVAEVFFKISLNFMECLSPLYVIMMQHSQVPFVKNYSVSIGKVSILALLITNKRMGKEKWSVEPQRFLFSFSRWNDNLSYTTIFVTKLDDINSLLKLVFGFP